MKVVLLPVLLLLGACAGAGAEPSAPAFDPVYLAGEPSHDGIILQSRLQRRGEVTGEVPGFGDLPGFAGWGRFEISRDSAFSTPRTTAWMRAAPENDFLLKTAVGGLEPGTRYYYRVQAGADSMRTAVGRTAAFTTLPAPQTAAPLSFVMISCMNYEKFYGLGSMETQSDPAEWVKPATGIDRQLGFPGFEAVLERQPLFWIGNGDNVYYDSPTEQSDHHARTREELRAKWHRQLDMPRLRSVADRFPVYFLKDDHDYRYNDADTTDTALPYRFRPPGETGLRLPSHELGIAAFREQVPVVDPADPQTPTYRTVRAGKLLQLWFLEGRDYRSPNGMPDGPAKTLWGEEQREWLKRTLLESDATFKIIVSPTPIVGPDDAYKQDNHANLKGFRHEGQEFIRWLEENGLSRRVFLLNGDRHWQYHSIHPTGFEEFSSGALVSQNARSGRVPGDPRSSDPLGSIEQPYIQEVPVGGFLEVSVQLDAAGNRPSILFTHYDERGKVLYATRRYARS